MQANGTRLLHASPHTHTHVSHVHSTHRISRSLPPSSLQHNAVLNASSASPHVLFQDDRLIAVYKPAGLSYHNDDADGAPGLVATLRAMQAEGRFPPCSLHSVHRLDKTTSGIVIFAKNASAASALSAGFRHRLIHKYYVALADRKPSRKMGTVRGDMVQARRGAWMLTRDATAKAAVTCFTSRGVVGVSARPLRVFLLRPLTGKTHQLRVAMKSLGSPVLGDGTYAAKHSAMGEDRSYLHAVAIRIPSHVWTTSSAVDSTATAVQIVCPPFEGVEFTSAGFTQAFEAWFPPSAASHHGKWFDGLLESSLLLHPTSPSEATTEAEIEEETEA